MMSGILHEGLAVCRNKQRTNQKELPPMSMPALFKGRLSIPVIGAPLFII